MRHIRLVAPDIHAGDAVGNHCLELVRIFNSNGLRTTAYAERHSLGVLDITQFSLDLMPEDIIILSFSIYDPHLFQISKYKNFKVCYFHGITSPKYLREHDPITADLCEMGLKQRKFLKNFNRVICNSIETAQSLLGFVEPKKVFILHPITQQILAAPQKKMNKKNNHDEALKIIMLGRIVPHKGVEDGILLIKLLRDLGIAADLELVGSFGPPSYINHIKELVTQFNIAEMVNFHGYINEDRKSRLLKISDIFFSASYHEGFGIPALEAMGYDLSVMVRKTAIPRTIATQCYSYTTVEEAALKITKLFAKKSNGGSTQNFRFYNLLFNKYSDKFIFEFFKNEIFT